MGVEILNPYARLQLRFVDSVVDGRERLMSRSFSGVKVDATDEVVFQAAMILGGLQLKPLKHVNRLEGKELVQA